MRNESPGSGDADPVPAEKKNIDTIPDRGWFFYPFRLAEDGPKC